MRTLLTQMPNRRNFWWGKYGIEIGYPWLTYGSIIAIEGLIEPHHTVLEFGCGGSTVFWSKRCKEVKTYENKEYWANRVRPAIGANVNLIVGDEDFISRCLEKEPDGYYDWVLSDIHPLAFRLKTTKDCVPKIKKGGFLVIDNYREDFINTFGYAGFDVFTFDQMHIAGRPRWYYGGRGTKICVKQ